MSKDREERRAEFANWVEEGGSNVSALRPTFIMLPSGLASYDAKAKHVDQLEQIAFSAWEAGRSGRIPSVAEVAARCLAVMTAMPREYIPSMEGVARTAWDYAHAWERARTEQGHPEAGWPSAVAATKSAGEV